ncbi:DNA primase [Actinomycetospora sp. NBRC 106375]|uniref:DNA primase n=1 Tax=Actinomycetospora sp. NBRC 106375 TaxID=3032207 RepID=UPI0024A2CE2C|nr:DNA primase [Actinomycetospora sp. NBRC 106375]GLZ47111.1 DNA primase [Actinomycetospora sp. NBRC 106375]
MAGRIRDADIAEVRDRNRVDEVIGEYVALRRASASSVKGLCPFHDEKTPSFNVRPTHGTFHCFGCGEGGSVIDFLMKIEQLGFVEAVEKLADRIGYRLTYEGGGSSVQKDRGTRARLLAANKLAAEFYAEQLRAPGEAQKAREFLAERGFDQAAAEDFGCGFAPSGWDKLTKHLVAQGYTLEELEKAGLSRQGQRGYMDRFHRRLLWPIRDLGGDVVGFGARRLFDDDRIEAKYLNTPETPVYHKSKVLFGLDKAKREIAKSRQAVIVEGYTDVMAMHLAGVHTAVASCGTAFGDDHVAVLRRLLMDDSFDRGEVIYVFDGDAAGQSAARKAFEGDQQFATQTYIAVAPDDMDPCDLRQARGEIALRDLVAQRAPLFTFIIRAILDEHDLGTVEGQVAALQRAVPEVARIRREDLRDGYARRLAGWVGWTDEAQVVRRVRETAGAPTEAPARRAQQRRAPTGQNGRPAGEGPTFPARDDPRLRVQREVLKAALQAPALAGPVYDSLPEDAFSNDAYLAVHRAVLGAGGTSAGWSGSAWIAAVGEELASGYRPLVHELAVEPLQTRETDEHRYITSMMSALQGTLVERQVSEIKSRLQRLSPIQNADEYHELYGDLVALEQYKKALRDQATGAVSL